MYNDECGTTSCAIYLTRNLPRTLRSSSTRVMWLAWRRVTCGGFGSEACLRDTPPRMSSPRYKAYLLCVLAVTLAFSFVDRLALGLLLQDIKADLHLSDTQLGLLSGLAFALFYSVMGIPIAHWADRG